MAVSRIKQALMTLSILIVLTFFVFYAIEVVYPGPQWDEYCDEPMRYKLDRGMDTQPACEAVNGKWNPRGYECPPTQDELRPCPDGWCDVNYYCQKEYEGVRDIYERDIFFVSVTMGLILLFAGLALKGASVSTGIMGGGVLILFVGLTRYWGELHDYLRLIILAVILALLIWVGYTKVDRLKPEETTGKTHKTVKTKKRSKVQKTSKKRKSKKKKR